MLWNRQIKIWAFSYAGTFGSVGRRGEEDWDAPFCLNHMCTINHDINHFKCWCFPFCPALSACVSSSHQAPVSPQTRWSIQTLKHNGLFSLPLCLMNRLFTIGSRIFLERKHKCTFRPLWQMSTVAHIYHEQCTISRAKFCKNYVDLGLLLFCR